MFDVSIASAALIIGFFLLWELLCRTALSISDIVLPKPSQIIATLWQRLPQLWPHTVQTLYTTLVGFGFGILIGISLGMLVGSSRIAYDVAYPLLIGFASIPKVAVVPIFVLWFGAGCGACDPHRDDHVDVPDCGERRDRACDHGTRTRRRDEDACAPASSISSGMSGLPRTMPYFFASLKVAVTLAFVGVVLSETVASNRGIGNVMMIASPRASTCRWCLPA